MTGRPGRSRTEEPRRAPGPVAIRCDAGARSGAGHLVRCVALAEELRSRDVEVIFLGDVSGSEWARAQLDERDLPLVAAPRPPAELAARVRELGVTRVVLDSYELAPGTGAALRQAGAAVLAIVDGDPRGQEADLYLDQNLDAERRPFTGERLAGADYVLLRDSVRQCDRVARDTGARDTGGGGAGGGDGRTPRVLCFFGGTDAAGVAPAWVEALCATGRPFEAIVISEEPFETRGPIVVIPPTDALPELMAQADLVVTAAGSASWELLYLGVPTALTWVADNQLIGYEALVGRSAAAGLGDAPGPAAVETLSRLLADPACREEYGRRGGGLVDGKGRERVADALLAL
ncbi:spore coat protein [Nonomuraea sp. NN258]|nr:spore coat protein [Nonomuraea antri]